jgi:hypothetical protein
MATDFHRSPHSNEFASSTTSLLQEKPKSICDVQLNHFNPSKMRKPIVSIVIFLLLSTCVLANTEKVIFVAPPAPLEPLESQRALETLSPSKPALRKVRVQLSFETPTEEFFALESLDIGRKYEVRVCWPASVILIHIAMTGRLPPNSVLLLSLRIVLFHLEDV